MALSLIHKAFSVLSDKEKRAAFDLERTLSTNCMANMNLQETSNGGRSVDSETSGRSNNVTTPRQLHPKRPTNVGGNPCTMGDGVRNSAIGMDHEVSTQWEKVNVVSSRTTTRGYQEVEKPVASLCRSSFRVVNRKGHDADYFDFETNRKSESFAVGQIWAAYDQENMPRGYVQISKVNDQLSKLSVTWLNPAPVSSDEKKWCEVRLPVVCGFFELAISSTVISEWKVFSHCISHFKSSTDEHIEIYPQKGNVWAIYKNWQPSEWCSNPQSWKGCGFFMVEILKSYSKHEGLVVAPLERVPGFTSIFQRCVHKGSESSLKIPANHLFRFSHNVPAFRFTGREREKICNGMLELDPLVIPGDLVDYESKPSERVSSSPWSSLTLPPSLSPPVFSDQETIPVEPEWSKKYFVSGHIWAVYDYPDSMPQRYVRVNYVLPDNAVCATFLEPSPTSDDEIHWVKENPTSDDEIHWVKENLPFVCGIFRARKTTSNLKTSLFSHLVTCKRSTAESLYMIFPKKVNVQELECQMEAN